jgi:pyridoxal/pyridoxine/pyridoxamine kinase
MLMSNKCPAEQSVDQLKRIVEPQTKQKLQLVQAGYVESEDKVETMLVIRTECSQARIL